MPVIPRRLWPRTCAWCWNMISLWGRLMGYNGCPECARKMACGWAPHDTKKNDHRP